MEENEPFIIIKFWNTEHNLKVVLIQDFWNNFVLFANCS